MLSIPNGSIRIELIPLSEFQLNGKDQIKIWFSANKGSRPDELKNIASGGELSRIALCLKSLVADKMVLPTLLFDEIDQGVSGEVAHQMGKIMRNLADKHQVICITHSAQIAAKGKKHFYIYKDHSGEKTQTKLKLLEQEERANEIATMLSGQNPSASALANALELLEQ
jgi:DNA repair protein RecN (Recombination protein N)